MREQRPLSEHPGDLVRLDCTRCERAGQYRKDKLLALHGDIGLVDLLLVLSKDCPLFERDAQGIRHCGARYVGLSEPRPPAAG